MNEHARMQFHKSTRFPEAAAGIEQFYLPGLSAADGRDKLKFGVPKNVGARNK